MHPSSELLFDAVISGSIDDLISAIAAGGRVTAVDHFERTPLHWAAWFGHDALVEILINAGCPVDARDTTNSTALHCSAGEGRHGTVELLLAAGADPCACNHLGRTPAACARQGACFGLARYLESRAVQRQLTALAA